MEDKELLELIRNPIYWQKGIYYTEETLKKAVKLFIKNNGR